MVFINTNPLSEVTKFSTVFLKFLLSSPAVTFEEEKILLEYLFYCLVLIAVKETEQKKYNPHTMKISACY